MAIGQDFKTIDAVIEAAIPKSEKEWVLELVPRDKALPFKTHLPVLTLKAAAGKFGGSQEVKEEGWVAVNGRKLSKDMFVAQVGGHSMEPRIPDGSYCVFHRYRGGSRNGKVVLAEHRDVMDPETGGCYTVKLYESKKMDRPGETWEHESIVLKPINKAYQPLIISSDGDHSVKVIAEFERVLER
jgi:phage repressor protein C with HTH and peptisase S24 domain